MTATTIKSCRRLSGLYPFNPSHLLHTVPDGLHISGLSCTPLGLILLNDQDNLLRVMMPVVKSAYTGLLAKNMFLKHEKKVRDDEEQAREAGKRPQAGMTVAHLGIHCYSTGPVLKETMQRALASKAARDKGKGKAVNLSILAVSQPLGEPAD